MRKGEAGGKATAIKLRREALERYYANPNICLYCEEIIQVKDNQRITEVRAKKFCDRTCAGKYNGSRILNLKGKEYKVPSRLIAKSCSKCNKEIVLTTNRKGRWNRNIKLCQECKDKQITMDTIENLTKAQVFNQYKTWQAARGRIRQHAIYVYKQSGLSSKCKECGYELHTEICHKVPVSDWKDDALVSEINAIDNLVALCPNHHWEFDHGFLKEE